MAASTSRPVDLYAELQVHPDADQEVIDAAYRQLMKKYHPDLAGDDPARIALHHERAKAINSAYSVLRDPAQRERYDAWRSFGRPRPAAASAGQAGRATAPPPPPTAAADQGVGGQNNMGSWAASAAPGDWTEVAEARQTSAPLGPLAALKGLYYLLPGPYEWEAGSRQELMAIGLLPFFGIAAFVLATGRFNRLVGQSSNLTLIAWAVVLVVAIPAWRALPRAVLASAPTVAVMSGLLDPLLRQASMPIWVAWVLLGVLSLILAARVYVFAVLPALCVCWLLVRFG